MIRMLRRRRGRRRRRRRRREDNNMTLRTMRLRREDRSQDRKHTLCEPASAKCTWTFHKSHVVWKLTGKCRTRVRARHYVQACVVETHMDISQEPCCVEIYRKCRTRVRARHCVRACVVETHMDISQEPCCVETYRKMPDASPGTALCASLCSRNAHGHFTRAMLCGNLQENAGRESGHGIVCEPV